ncbi:MAG: HD domain-containing protein [Candidatus Wallbacteria bacterium]|nr:HD domain-containing protein [Candidatus Wallbacteria bacterium]
MAKLHATIIFVFSLLTAESCLLLYRSGQGIAALLISLLLFFYLALQILKRKEVRIYNLLFNPLALNIDWYLVALGFFQLLSLIFLTTDFTPALLSVQRIVVLSVLFIMMIDIFYDVKQLKSFLIDINQKLEEKLIEINNFQIISKALNSILDLERLLNMILDIATNLLKVEIVTLFLLDKENQLLVPKIYRGMTEEVAQRSNIKVGDRIVGYVAKTGENLLIKDIDLDPRFAHVRSQEKKYRTNSLVCVPLKIKDEVIGVLSVNNKINGREFNDSDLEMAMTMASQAAIAIENASLYENMHKSYISTVRALSAAIDAKDKYTSGHSTAVTEYTIPIAREMKLSQAEIEKLEYAGLLHDIGKIGVMEQILNKPGRLTNEEFGSIKKHPVIGFEILKSIDFLKDVTLLVRHHHERFDGKGYPDGLVGEAIPLGARIIAVADTFDAMTSDRPYRKGLPVEIALKEIRNCSGSQFDPRVVEAFVSAYDRGSIKLHVTGEELTKLADAAH